MKYPHIQDSHTNGSQKLLHLFHPLFFVLMLLGQSFCSLAQSEVPVEKNQAISNTPTTKQTVHWGTGFVIDNEYLLTAWHVVQSQKQILVGPILSGRWVLAEVVQSDAKLDLALLKARINLPPLWLSPGNQIPHGLEVSVIGFPQPKMQGLSKKISQGIVNGYRTDQEQALDTGFIQFSAEVAQGNSGGPVFGPDGTVIGMVQRKLNSEKLTDFGANSNVSFAIRSSALIKFLQNGPANPRQRQVSIETLLRPYQVFNQSQASVLAVIARDALIPEAAKSP
jgi:S1-C subfamily serine protease